MTGNEKKIKIALLLAGLLLCSAVIPLWPPFYYVVIRAAAMAACAYVAIKFKGHSDLNCHVVPLVIVAMAFNPLIPAYDSRFMWVPVYLAGALYLLHLSKKIR